VTAPPDAAYFVSTESTAVRGADDFFYLPAFRARPPDGADAYEELPLTAIAAVAVEAGVGISILAAVDAAKPVRLLSLGDVAELAATGALKGPALGGGATPNTGTVLRIGPPPASVLSAIAGRALSRYIEATYGITHVKLAIVLGTSSYRGAMLNIAPAMLDGPAAFRLLLERAKWFLPSDVELVYTPFFLSGAQFDAIPELDALP
jgi:hypothetical protein